MPAVEMMHETIWFDQPKFEEAECHYQLHLASKNAPSSAAADKDTTSGAPSLVSEIEKARKSIQQTLTQAPSASSQPAEKSVASLEKENKELKKLIEDLTKRMSSLEMRMAKVEGSPEPAVTEKPKDAKKSESKDDNDDDFDLFGSSDEEDDDEAERIKAERLAQYAEKKSKKKAVIAKSSILLDVKPWADDTDLVEMEKLVRSVEADGLVWGASKLVPVAFGIKKLQISCVVEDDKIGTDFLEEEIEAFEELVQSVDIAAFNKI